MRTSNFIIIFLFSFLFSCKKETFVGPPIETYFGNLTISESFSHNKLKVLGIMWHPERYKKIKNFDKNLIKNFFHKY